MSIGIFQSIFIHPYTSSQFVSSKITERSGKRLIISVGFSFHDKNFIKY